MDGDQPANAGDGARTRAVLLVPGMGAGEIDQRAKTLAANLEAVVQTRHVTRGEQITIPGMTGQSLSIEPLVGASDTGPSHLHIFEAHWSDLPHKLEERSPWGRLWDGLELVFYWILHPANLKLRPAQKWAGPALLTSAGLLLAWYLTIAMNVASAVGGDPTNDPRDESGALATAQFDPASPFEENAGSGETADVPTPQQPADSPPSDEGGRESVVEWLYDTFIASMQWLAQTSFWGLLVLIIGFLQVDRIANLARGTKDYLLNRAAPTTEDGEAVGLRDRLRRRVIEKLRLVLDAEGYDDVVVVAHSFGAALAVDALREWPRDEDLSRLKLVTLGAPFQIMETRSTDLEVDRMKLLEEKRLRWWRDYWSDADHYGAPVPGHDGYFPGGLVPVKVETWWWPRLLGRPHDSYYHADAVLTDLATHPCGSLEERYVEQSDGS